MQKKYSDRFMIFKPRFVLLSQRLFNLVLSVLFLISISNFSCIYAMKDTSEQIVSLVDLPDDVWKEIFWWINEKVETYKNYRDDQERIRYKLDAIQKIVRFTTVCKRLNKISTTAIKCYLAEYERDINALGGKDLALYKSLTEEWRYWQSSVVTICRKLGANINSMQYYKGETFLTHAIEKRSITDILNLLQLGADPMYPNYRGEVPIDLAYDDTLYPMARFLKEHGGDPDNRYGRTGGNSVYRKDSYGRQYGLNLLEAKDKNCCMTCRRSFDDQSKTNQQMSKATNNNIPHSPAVNFGVKNNPNSPIYSPNYNSFFVFGTGVFVGIMSWLLYGKCKKSTRTISRKSKSSEIKRMRSLSMKCMQ
jgi:hypothetical protein